MKLQRKSNDIHSLLVPGVLQQSFNSLKYRCTDTINLQWFQPDGASHPDRDVKTLECIQECTMCTENRAIS